jgi:hypothetical protein
VIFTVPEGYSVVHKGQVIFSTGGVIQTDDKALIESLSSNPKAEAEQPKRGRPFKKDEDQ